MIDCSGCGSFPIIPKRNDSNAAACHSALKKYAIQCIQKVALDPTRSSNQDGIV